MRDVEHTGRRGGQPHRAAPEPLANRVLVRTDDPELASERFGAYLARHRLILHSRQPRFLARMNASQVGPVLVAYIDYGADLTVRASELGNLTALLLPLTGWLRVRQGGVEIVSSQHSGAILRSDLESTLVWSEDLSLVTLAFDHQALNQHLGRMIGSGRKASLTLDQTIRPEQRASTWNAMLHPLLDLASGTRHGGTSPLVAAEVGRAVMTTLLLSQPHDHYRAMLAPAPPTTPKAVRMVAETMRADPGADHDLTELAAMAGVSVRSLQAGFRRMYGVSPTTYLREVRLDRVHEALASADPASRTVTEVATEWGFANLGRFAGEYRKRFGQPPSATLRTG